ncbi:hypothetical protein [Streptococcus suis]|uniref:hypothetical protein n=1 Tax=Streptococcus suis TaxID=1307 RepID=UPI0013750A6C|nr:hypothetical protein [Streptococcus suis]HEM2809316.1 hypothetical protein [Streptococcus suis]
MKLREIGITKKAIDKDGHIMKEVGNFIHSLKSEVHSISQIVHGHCLLDLVYREDKK